MDNATEEQQGSLLIVDDDQAHRVTLRRYLEPKGLAVTEAAHGAEALGWVGKQAFDVILLDVVMPGLSGFQVLEAIRRLRSMTELPVIMATAKDQSSDVVEALRLRANDYVTKPFDFPVVLARVQTQLALKRSVERIARLEQSLAQQNAELEAVNRRMRRDLEAAARVQQALLPAAPPLVAGANFAWQFRPCTELAGDLFNVAVLDDRHVALYILDVMGHGAQAALLAVMVSKALAQLLMPSGRLAENPALPCAVADRLSKEFPWNPRTEQFFTFLYGVLSMDKGEFRFVSAGHPGPLHLALGGEARCLKVPGLPIGLGNGTYEENNLTLQKGDRLYLYSDGLTDARSAEGKPYGADRLCQVLEQAQAAPLALGLTNLIHSVADWCGQAEPTDDFSVLAVERA